jgi:SpoVK/Ycf46/Vps4 family AAA+-type ATPase
LWLQSSEQEDALSEIARLCHDHEWRLAVWDIDRGLRIPGSESAEAGAADPLAAIRALNALAAAPDADDELRGGSALLVLVNFHRFLNSAEIVQALVRQITDGKQRRTFVVVLSPIVQIPIELEKLFVVVEHELPGRVHLAEIARGIATEEGELPQGAELERLLDSAAGLTRYEAEGAFALSLARHGRVTADVVWELKSQTLKKSGLVGLHRGNERFEQLGGLDNLKAFALRALRPWTESRTALCRPRGILLLSPPGCGKSQFAKALGHETQRPTLTLDIGALMGSLVGQTEQNVRQALRIADAMAPCVVFLDEIEKGLAGASSSGSGDSGVSARLFGTLLTWLNDHTSDVFVVATCNDISRLPPEFARAERFDGVFFVDLPSPEQRQSIWRIYLDLFGLDARQKLPPDDRWTGAEIRACCRLAVLLDVPLVQAAQNVVPVAVTNAETVERLRTWASGRCLSADEAGIYQFHSSTKARRRVNREPSNN